MGNAELAVSLIALAIQAYPEVSAAIQLSQMPPVSDATMAQLVAARDAAIAKLDADIAAAKGTTLNP